MLEVQNSAKVCCGHKIKKIDQLQMAIPEKPNSDASAFLNGANCMSWSSESTFRSILSLHIYITSFSIEKFAAGDLLSSYGNSGLMI